MGEQRRLEGGGGDHHGGGGGPEGAARDMYEQDGLPEPGIEREHRGEAAEGQGGEKGASPEICEEHSELD
ncbi:MAG: hypothetical protein NVS9B1_20700 [Candidatus Dormibacteraceae bacterium]